MELSVSARSTTSSDLAIHNNEVPAASSTENIINPISAESLVQSFLATSALHLGAPAKLPRESNTSTCEACGRPEAEGCVVVCDGCERGFHVYCSGMLNEEAVELEDWTCGKCSGSGVISNRWRLGWRNKRRRLDTDSVSLVNGSPRSEGCNSFRSQVATDSLKLQPVRPSSGAVCSSLEGLTEENITTMGSSTKDQSDTYLQTLKEYLKDKHDLLVEGWHVELEHNSITRELCPVYVGPDGKRLWSVSEVASYLKSIIANMPTQCGTGKYDDGLPIQYGDFFVLSVGEVDARQTYNCKNQIWPVGYSSCWHDKVTGSLFTCHVLDGGDSGPLFKVKRSPCSTFPIPDPKQVLYQTKHDHCNNQNERSYALSSQSIDYEDLSIMSILADTPAPSENDVLYCLGHSSGDYLNMRGSHAMLIEKSSFCERNQGSFSDFSSFGHDADFSVEASSSTSAWRVMSKKILNVFREVYTHIGVLKFFCKHVVDQSESFSFAIANEESAGKYAPLARFYGLPNNVNIPHLIQADMQLEVVAEELLKWLDQDRFGLDAEFVQEIIEQRQDIGDIFGYVPLNQRTSFSSSITVGNSLLEGRALEVENKDGRSPSHGLKCFNEVNIRRIGELLTDTCSLPPGRPFSTMMPSLFLGDAIQVLEFFWRFYELLGLKEPLTFEDIEGELINPWFHGVLFLDNAEGGNHENPFIIQNKTDGTKKHSSCSSYSSGPEVDLENPDSIVKKERKLMKEGFPAKLELIKSSKCLGSALPKAAISMLQVLISEFQTKVAAVGNLNFDIGDSRKRGRKKDLDYVSISKRNKLSMLPCNELTWPELARKYALALLLVNGRFDAAEITTHDSAQIVRCLQGDGGALCGALTGVAGIEADAWLLAEATKRIFGSLDVERDHLAVDDEDTDRKCLEERVTVSASIPDWVQALEPARKLPTNVGARIKRCIYNALERSPPEWARKILEHSISKEVYKGNASGPTKRAVLSVLSQAHAEDDPHVPVIEKKKKFISISGLLMKQCRLVLRQAMSADHRKVFCNLLGKRITNYNNDGGIIGSLGMVSRPLDFRTIDQRLAVNAYGGMHMAFYEDVCEVWSNVFIAFKQQPDLLQLAENLASGFNSLYDKEVVSLYQKLVRCSKLHSVDASLKKEIEEILACKEFPKAPWEDGVCKVCGIDNDDKSVLLCDTCDAEYHTYCLNPPLARIPSGNWYCPSCVTNKQMVSDAYAETAVLRQQQEKHHGEFTHAYIGLVEHLATVMGKKEYWELSVDERTSVLKFLCDELLNSALLREHLERSSEDSIKLQQRLHTALKELKALELRESFLARNIDESSLMGGECNAEVNESVDTFTGNNRCSRYLHTLSDNGNHTSSAYDTLPSFEDGQKCVDPNVLPIDCLENSDSVNCQSFEPMDVDDAEDASPMAGDGQLSGSSFTNSTSLGQNINMLSCEETKGLNGQGAYENISGKHVPNLNIPNPEDLDELHGCENMNATHLNAHLLTMNMSTAQVIKLRLESVRNEILRLQSSITTLQKQLQNISFRSEFLGVDSAGRLYWAVSNSDAKPSIIVNENVQLQMGERISSDLLDKPRGFASCGTDKSYTCSGSNAPHPFWCEPRVGGSVHSSWTCYESDSEIQMLLDFLKDDYPLERKLKESILCWQKQRYDLPLLSKFSAPHEVLDANLATRATSLLKVKYGSSVELEASEFCKQLRNVDNAFTRDGIYRCKCLEPILSFKRHCIYCHQTFFAEGEIRFHAQGKCISSLGGPKKHVEADHTSKQKGRVKSRDAQGGHKGEVGNVDQCGSEYSKMNSQLVQYEADGLGCPFNLGDICSKFVIEDSMKDVVAQIGLLSSQGIPTFVPSLPPYLSDPASLLFHDQDNTCSLDHNAEYIMKPTVHDIPSQNSPARNALEQCDTSKHDVLLSNCLELKESGLHHDPGLESVSFRFLVSNSALKPLVGEASQILRQLKINLLDMDAALPEEALRSSKSQVERRRAWIAFVKSAQTIYEVVQALIVFEETIKSQYLSKTWWYWSSISAAAKICTLSSLALRIYSLDAAIKYDDDGEKVTAAEKTKLGRKVSKKKKDL